MFPGISIEEAMRNHRASESERINHRQPLLDLVLKHFPSTTSIIVKGSGIRWAQRQGFRADLDDLDMLIVVDNDSIYTSPEASQVALHGLFVDVRGEAAMKDVRAAVDLVAQQQRLLTSSPSPRLSPAASPALSSADRKDSKDGGLTPLQLPPGNSKRPSTDLGSKSPPSTDQKKRAGSFNGVDPRLTNYSPSPTSGSDKPRNPSPTSQQQSQFLSVNGPSVKSPISTNSQSPSNSNNNNTNTNTSNGQSQGQGQSVNWITADPDSPLSPSVNSPIDSGLSSLNLASPATHTRNISSSAPPAQQQMDGNGKQPSPTSKSSGQQQIQQQIQVNGLPTRKPSTGTDGVTVTSPSNSGSGNTSSDVKDENKDKDKTLNPGLGLAIEPLIISEKNLLKTPLVVVSLAGVSTLNGLAQYQYTQGMVIMGKEDTVRKIPTISLNSAIKQTAPLAMKAAFKYYNLIEQMQRKGHGIGSLFVVQNYDMFRRFAQVLYVKDAQQYGSKQQVAAFIQQKYPQFRGIGMVLMEVYERKVKTMESAKVIVGADELKGFLSHIARVAQALAA